MGRQSLGSCGNRLRTIAEGPGVRWFLSRFENILSCLTQEHAACLPGSMRGRRGRPRGGGGPSPDPPIWPDPGPSTLGQRRPPRASAEADHDGNVPIWVGNHSEVAEIDSGPSRKLEACLELLGISRNCQGVSGILFSRSGALSWVSRHHFHTPSHMWVALWSHSVAIPP